MYLFIWVVHCCTLKGTQQPRVELCEVVVALNEENVVLTVADLLPQVDLVDLVLFPHVGTYRLQ